MLEYYMSVWQYHCYTLLKERLNMKSVGRADRLQLCINFIAHLTNNNKHWTQSEGQNNSHSVTDNWGK
jgi:hypothetical protein